MNFEKKGKGFEAKGKNLSYMIIPKTKNKMKVWTLFVVHSNFSSPSGLFYSKDEAIAAAEEREYAK